ncbi:MAG TPA: AAA-like domain-containing protein [Pyrinomonadaceae bacterium]|nr:AAA-like domain-containing protein [Pyrinomonadaceae bacterium]
MSGDVNGKPGGGAWDLTGQLLDGRYLVESQLGRGGIGVVYLARDTKLMEKRVVVKVLLDLPGDDDTRHWVRRKFHEEIEALARIDHPGVVGVMHAGELQDGRPFIVMQYIEGSSLRSVMKQGPMALARAANIIRQIGHALSSAHSRGIIHRDLKPDNIMLQSLEEGDEHVRLIDFGIATVHDSQAAAGATSTRVAGTVFYMAPEQLQGRPSPASDIFAVAVLAYEMLTGARPFNPKSPYEVMETLRAGVRARPSELRPDLPAEAEEVILRALSFDEAGRPPSARAFVDALARALGGGAAGQATLASVPTQPLTTEILPAATAASVSSVAPVSAVAPATSAGASHVALLYRRNAEPDEHVLRLLEGALAAEGLGVFVDRNMKVGVEWAKEIERQVRTAGAVVPLLSAASMSSEMLAYELQIAHEAAQRAGRPRILPVRVAYEGALPESIAGILSPIQYTLWSGPEDDGRLAAELLAALKGGIDPAAVGAERRIEPPGGAVPLDSRFYLVRPTDALFLDALRRRDSIVLVKGARQMGKTSILARGFQQARSEGSRVVVTDFQKLNASDLESAEKFFVALGGLIADQLDLDVYPEDVWKERRAPSVNFERYVRREVLGKVDGPVVWGMDEVDRLFTCPFGSEVFGLFRTWHNERAVDPEAPWGRLTLAIAYATEAHLFITDQNQSPFNVGTRLELRDFTREQVAELNARAGSPLRDEAEIDRFYRLLGGHPYLVRRGLHEMVTGGLTFDAFEALAGRDEGPFGDHLRRILVLLARDPAFAEITRAVLSGQPCPTSEAFYRLRSAGVMAGETQAELAPRCQLYADYLKRHLL